MRLAILLDEAATIRRRTIIAAYPDTPTDIPEEMLAERLAAVPGVDAVDLVDVDGTYLYTLTGEPR